MRGLRVLLGTLAGLLFIAGLAGAQPTVGSHADGVGAAATATTTLTGVNSGAAVCVLIAQTGTGARTVSSVADSEGTGNAYTVVLGTNNNIGTNRGTVWYCDLTISPGDGSLDITVTMSASAQPAIVAVEINPAVSGTFSIDTAGIGDTPCSTCTTHFAAPLGSLNTSTTVVVLMGCVGNSAFGTETVKAGGWAALDTDTTNQVMGQYLSSAGGLTGDRAEMTSASARDSECSSVSVKETAPAGGAIGKLTTLGAGV